MAWLEGSTKDILDQIINTIERWDVGLNIDDKVAHNKIKDAASFLNKEIRLQLEYLNRFFGRNYVPLKAAYLTKVTDCWTVVERDLKNINVILGNAKVGSSQKKELIAYFNEVINMWNKIIAIVAELEKNR